MEVIIVPISIPRDEEDTGYDADDEVASEDEEEIQPDEEHLSMDIPFIDLISDNDDVIHLIRDTHDQEYEDDDDDDDDQDASMDILVIDLVSDDDDDEDDDDDDDADTVILEPEELVRRVEDADFYNCSYTPSERSRRGRICRDPMWSQDYLFY
ncbi:nucleolin-like [Aphidius gifuensis]|uniref:nucleolin-like n=1 Tax=Aphidius gifuensis TaxID=684658 RepID=UPI001CDC20E6|nr:nucleolin-like [Aphidius gifuensis]